MAQIQLALSRAELLTVVRSVFNIGVIGHVESCGVSPLFAFQRRHLRHVGPRNPTKEADSLSLAS
jgi:hypothetical protein